jgi:phosphoenolpyruvate carboxylase
MPRQDLFFPVKDAALREDVHVLGALVGEVIREQGGDALYDAVESNRQAAISHREGDEQGIAKLLENIRGISADVARDLVRAFTTWFEMVNMAEKVHRIRRRREYLNEGTTQPSGVEDALMKLKAHGLSASDVARLMLDLWIEPVLTAHPTESTRRTLLRKQQRVAQLLLSRLGLVPSAAETLAIWRRVRAEITSGWQTAENSRERLTVADEREHVLFFIAEILYEVVPVFYEEFSAALEKVYGPEAGGLELPDVLRFGSWVGGDMDGNPDVHAKTIRETLARHQQLIVNNYFLECQALQEVLSQSATRVSISAELQARIDRYTIMLPGALTPARHDRMPYRVFLGQVLERLRATYDGRQYQYESVDEFRQDIKLMADSLAANKGEHAGLFQVRRLQRRIRTFGFHLATLDIRQNSGVHRAVIGQGLADDGWAARTSEERLARLREVLAKDEGPTALLDATGRRTLWVFEALAHCRHRYGPDAIGPYVVSSARGADDVLSVLVLARWADTADRRSGDVPVDVAPLFESAEALERCGGVFAQLLDEPLYRRHLAHRGNRQYVMIGYSASNKDTGMIRSRWLVRRAQEALFATAKQAGVELTLFHGQAGGLDRGGGRTEVLVRTGPNDARCGRLRITEAGELIKEKYGLHPIALRIFEQSFNALSLAATGVMPAERVEQRWCDAMELMATESARVYRGLVYDDPQFHEFFRQVTPIDVIERMQIGSRPATRSERKGIAALRSIPWVHAWSQSRYMLPGWFGAGSALATAVETLGWETLEAMYARWYFFENLIDEIELSLARADLEIAALYETLVDEPLRRFVPIVRAEYALTKEHILRLKGCARLLDGEPTIQRSIRLRSPYIDPLHLVQVELLGRWRASGRENRDLLAALLASVTGISQALQGA